MSESKFLRPSFFHPPGEGCSHSHSHGEIDPSILSHGKGIWAVKWSFGGLLVTTLLQAVVVWFSGSVALLADTIHNLGDAATAIPLGIAFWLAKRPPSRRFPYGLGRTEDLAGLAVVSLIFFSAMVAGYESIRRLLHPTPVQYVGAVALASLIGFLGNEVVALFRIRVGKQIGSAALIADGYHARADGLTSLSVLVSAIGVHLGYPLVDPLVGLVITLVILGIVWESARMVIKRMLDGVDPEVLEEIEHAINHEEGVQGVGEIRARWIGHRLHAEVNIGVAPRLSVSDAHRIAKAVRYRILQHLPHLDNVIVHVDPTDELGEAHHKEYVPRLEKPEG